MRLFTALYALELTVKWPVSSESLERPPARDHHHTQSAGRADATPVLYIPGRAFSSGLLLLYFPRHPLNQPPQNSQRITPLSQN